MDSRPPLAILAGVRVVSFTQFLLGPSGVQFLADLGADVVKVEPPGGRLWERNWSGADLFKNGVSVFFMLAHRNQRSLTLDLKHPEGRAVARLLVEGADVLVQNFRPGVMARHGLDWETVKSINPRLVYVSASGYGESSPYRDRPGQDLLMQGISGLASISGRADQPPTAVGTAVIDQHGATLLALGVLGARLEKTQTPLASTFHPPPYGIFPTLDGHLILSMSPLAQLAEALELPALRDLAKPGWNFESREAVAWLVEPLIRTRTTAAWIERLVPTGVWAAAVNDYAETFADPAVQAADAVEEISHPVAGPVKLLRFPLEFSTGRAGVRLMPPGAGQHTDTILSELGYDDAAIARLRKDGAV